MPEDETVEEKLTLKSLADLVSSLAGSVEKLVERVNAQPTMLPLTETPDTVLDRAKFKGLEAGQARSGHRVIDPSGRRPAFRADDVIKLLEEDEDNARKAELWRETGRAGEGPIYGVVSSFMLTRRRDGVRKYKVNFPGGIGDEGVMENEMTLVRAA